MNLLFTGETTIAATSTVLEKTKTFFNGAPTVLGLIVAGAVIIGGVCLVRWLSSKKRK